MEGGLCGAQHVRSSFQDQPEVGQAFPEGGDGELVGPPWGRQHFLSSHQNSELWQSDGPDGVDGVELEPPEQQRSPSDHGKPLGQDGVDDGGGECGAQHPKSSDQDQPEDGHFLPEGGEGGVDVGPP